MSDALTPEEERARDLRTRKLLTWLIIFAIVMFFAGLTSAYVVSMSGGYWVDLRLPSAFLWSTALIVISSITAQLALMAGRAGSMSRVPMLLGITLVLGLGFAGSQFIGWKQLMSKGNFVVSKVMNNTGTYGEDYSISRNGIPVVLEQGDFFLETDHMRSKPLNAELAEQQNVSSSYLYVLTAAHLGHMVFGLISVLVMLIMAFLGRYTRNEHAGLWAGVVFWHFLAGLWVYLLLFLTFVH